MDQRKEMEKTIGEGQYTETSEDMPATVPNGRGVGTSRSGRPVKPSRKTYTDGADSESDEAQSSGKEWSGNEDEDEVEDSEPDFDAEDEDDEDMSDRELEADGTGEDDNTQDSLVVQLRYRKGKEPPQVTDQQPPPQAVTNGVSVPSSSNGMAPSENAGKPEREPVVKDTIDVATPLKASKEVASATNGVDEPDVKAASSLSQQLAQQPAQAMDLS